MFVLMVTMLAMVLPRVAYANVARMEFTIGQVTGIDAGGRARALRKGSVLAAGDTVRTGQGRAQIRFSDGGYTSLQPGTEFRIDDYHYDRKDVGKSRSFFSLLKGGLRTITGTIGHLRKKSYQLRTPVATIGIRGTEYLASLDNSLTVHVGEGEIEVCSELSCANFGSHETGFVPDRYSPPIQVENPPSLAPPQERQIYALNPQYQNEIHAGAEYSSSEDRDANGLPSILGGTLPDGELYALAVSWGESYTNVDLFAKGLLDPPGELTDGRFGDGGQLVKYLNNNFGSAPIQGEVLTAGVADVGVSDGVIGWGRWTGGSAVVGKSGGGSTSVNLAGSSSHHYVIGLPTADMPSGTASYSLVGATSPTLASGAGAPGTVTSASLLANFDLSTVDLDMNLAVNGNGYNLTAIDMGIGGAPNNFTFAGGGDATNASDCVSFCTASV
jgi:hypothetical protein